MTTATTIRFTAKIRRWDADKLVKRKAATMASTDIRINLTIVDNLHTAVVHVEITGDEHQANAFKEWVQTFALEPLQSN